MKNTLFITVGTTEFDQLMNAIDSSDFFGCISTCGFNRIVIQMGRGVHTPNELKAYCERNSIECEIYRFKNTLDEDMRNADLIISHCGAGSILEVITMGKPLVVVVNTSLQDNHQTELSDALTEGKYCYSTVPSKLVDTLLQRLKNPLNDGVSKLFPINNPDILPGILDRMFGF